MMSDNPPGFNRDLKQTHDILLTYNVTTSGG